MFDPLTGKTDERTIEGVLWALAIMVPIYAVIAWILVSYL
jgi:hypothetical protein